MNLAGHEVAAIRGDKPTAEWLVNGPPIRVGTGTRDPSRPTILWRKFAYPESSGAKNMSDTPVSEDEYQPR
ncbi:MAG: hypothetical protein ACREDR_41335, partial [Blastocatellia bacterium]